eukprot:533518_1
MLIISKKLVVKLIKKNPMETEINDQWIECDPLPAKMTNAAITRMNSNELLISPYYSSSKVDTNKIFKFNIHSNKFIPYMDYPENFTPRYHGMTYDKINNLLYLYNPDAEMFIYNNNTKTHEINTKCCIVGNNSVCLLSIKGITHLIGGVDNSRHLIWNNNKEFQLIHDFKQQFSEMNDASAVYVESKNIIVLIGGYYRDGIAGTNFGIWIYNLHSKEWKQIKNNCTWHRADAILTANEKYIIISTAMDDFNGNDMFILNMSETNSITLQKSNIKTPKPGYHHIIRTGNPLKDELLVFGYIKLLFNTNEFIDLDVPPIYIIKLIGNWYIHEMINWFEWNVDDNKNDHYIISVKKILSSIDQTVPAETINI